MPEFEPDQESVARAATLSSRLMQDLRSVAEEGPPSRMRHKLFSEQRYSEQAEGVPINDVVTHVGKMATEFAMARRWDNEILCLKLDDGEFAPISIGDYFGGSSSLSYGSDNWLELWEREFPFPFPLHRLWREVLRSSPEQEGLIVTNVPEAAVYCMKRPHSDASVIAVCSRSAVGRGGLPRDAPGVSIHPPSSRMTRRRSRIRPRARASARPRPTDQ